MTDTAALRERLERASQDLAGVEVATHGGSTTWSSAGVQFAVLDSGGVELRLDPAVARAATRTPDASSSPRGDAWVRFAPATLDGHAVDRLEAWFSFGYRRARAASGAGAG
jgi:hypothetical protein